MVTVLCMFCDELVVEEEAFPYGGERFHVYLCSACNSRKEDINFLAEFAKKMALEVFLFRLKEPF